jgi:DNA polymerase-3 subunit beta
VNITIDLHDLHDELRKLNQIVPAKPPVAVLGYVLLSADDGKLRGYATDQEVGLVTTCDAQVDEPGAVLLPMDKLLPLVDRFSDSEVQIGTAGKQVQVRCGGFVSKLQALPASDFIPEPVVEGTVCPLDGGVLQELIGKTRYAVDATNTKTLLRGALLTLTEGVGVMVGTDTKRLAMVAMPRTGPAASVIIPAKTLDVLTSMPPLGDITLTVGSRHIFFAADGWQLHSRMLEGQYPNYSRIIPKAHDKHVVVERIAFAAALRRMTLISEDTQAVYCTISDGALELAATNVNVGTAKETLRVEYEGPPLKVCINGEHVVDFLEAATARTITMSLKSAKDPVKFAEGDNHIAVILLMSVEGSK